MATIIYNLDDQVVKITSNEFNIVQIAIEGTAGMGYLIDDTALPTIDYDLEFANLNIDTHYTFELRNGEAMFIKCNGSGKLIVNEGTLV